jgi:hypothetical protein
MARPKGSTSTPTYRLHKATGQAVVTVNGKDHYLGKHGSKESKQRYDQLIGQWLSRGRATAETSAEDITITEVCAGYFEYAKSYYTVPVGYRDSHGHCAVYVAPAIRWLKKMFGNMKAADFRPRHLAAIQDQMAKTDRDWKHGKKLKLSRGYINDLSGQIKRLLKWAAFNELVPASVYHGVVACPRLKPGRTEARETAPVTPVDTADIEKTKPFLSSQLRDMVWIDRR